MSDNPEGTAVGTVEAVAAAVERVRASNTVDDMGDDCKVAESAEAGRAPLPGAVLIARFDGRSFHTYTAKAERPFDKRIQAAMVAAATAIVDDLRPVIAYTQSDEVTCIWLPTSGGQYPFGGKFQKVASVGAALASVAFTSSMEGRAAAFDGRAWQVSTRHEAFDVLKWREADATKNSISMLARAHFSHKQLHGKTSKDMRSMLDARGIVWGESQTHFKRGVFLRRVSEERALTDEERGRIPEAHRPAPGATFVRSRVAVIEAEPLSKWPGAIDALLPTAPS